MDLITQITLGATVGQFGYSRQLGKRALVWGGVGGLIPDLDVVVKIMSNPYAEVLYHRGISHSLFFGPVVGSLLGYFLWCYYGREKDHLRTWIGLMIAALITHPLLDVMTVYGTQLLAPFSNHRFVFSAIPIIEPIYTIPLILCNLWGILWGHHRLAWNQVISGLILFLTTCYLFLGLSINEQATRFVEKQLHSEKVIPEKVNVYTTMFQLPLRRVVVHTQNEYWIGLVSMWSPSPIQWMKFPKVSEKLFQEFEKTDDFQIYDWFTNGDYAYIAEPKGSLVNLKMTDLRYGFKDDSILGIWGLQMEVDQDGKILSQITKSGIDRTKTLKRFLYIQDIFELAFPK